jgi:hypothetical protein
MSVVLFTLHGNCMFCRKVHTLNHIVVSRTMNSRFDINERRNKEYTYD